MLFARLQCRALRRLALAACIGVGITGGLGFAGGEAAGLAVPPLAADRAVVPVQGHEKAGNTEKTEKRTQKPKSTKTRRFTPCGPGASIEDCKPIN